MWKLALGFALALFSGSGQANEGPAVDIVISQKVQNRQPVGPNLRDSDRFKIINNKLYAWTKLRRKIVGTHVHHVWYFQNQLMDDIRLPLSVQFGRLHSVKTVMLPYVGVWRVEVMQDDKTLLDSHYFLVEKIDNELVATVLERNRP